MLHASMPLPWKGLATQQSMHAATQLRPTWGNSRGVAQADEFVVEELRLDVRERLLRHALHWKVQPRLGSDHRGLNRTRILTHRHTVQSLSDMQRQSMGMKPMPVSFLRAEGLPAFAEAGSTWGASARRRMSTVSARVVRSLSHGLKLPFLRVCVCSLTLLLHLRKSN